VYFNLQMNGYKSIVKAISLASVAIQWRAKAHSSIAFSLEERCHIPLVQQAKGVEHDRDLSFNEFIVFLRQYHAHEFGVEWNDNLVRSFMRPTFFRLSTIYCTNLLKVPDQCDGSRVLIPKSLHDRGKDSTSILTKEENLYIFSVCDEGFRSLEMMQSPSFNGIVTITIYTPKAFDEWFVALSESWKNLCFRVANNLSSNRNVYTLHESYIENYDKGANTCDDEYSGRLANDLMMVDKSFSCYRVTLYAHLVLNKGFNQTDSSQSFFEQIERELGMMNVLDECDSTNTCIFKRFYNDSNILIGSEKRIVVSIGFALALGLVIAKFVYDKRVKQPMVPELNPFPLTIPRLTIEDEDILIEGGSLYVYLEPEAQVDKYENKSDTSNSACDIETPTDPVTSGNGIECNCDDIKQNFEEDNADKQNKTIAVETVAETLTEKHCRSVSLMRGGF
jgi:hypothetical protein